MPDPNNDDSAAALRAAVAAAERAADGDSNDAEIEALHDALSRALTRWPELHHAPDPIGQPADAADLGEPVCEAPPRTPTAANADTGPQISAELIMLPHTGIRVPDPAVTVSSLRHLPTPDGVAYTATLRRGRTPIGTIHNTGDGGATAYHPAPGSPFGRRQLALFVTASRTGDGQPISEEELLEHLITEYEHTNEVTTATHHGRSPLRLRSPLDADDHPAGGYYTAQHANAAAVSTATQRQVLAAELARTVAPGQWWQLWTGERWENLTPAPPSTAEDHR